MAPPLTAGRAVAKLVFAVTLLALALLVPAGTWRWPAAWVFTGLYVAFAIPVGAWLLRTNPAFLARRLDWTRRPPKKWDRILMAGYTPVYFAVYVLAGLDFRWGWADVPAGLRAAAFVLVWKLFSLSNCLSCLNPTGHYPCLILGLYRSPTPGTYLEP